MSRTLLDTSAYSAFLRGHDEVKETVQRANEIHVSPVILGELRAGFRRGKLRRENEQLLRSFLESPRVTVLDITEETSLHYAEILFYLRTAGTPIPTNDLWIAATAMQHGLTLVTTDRHFLRLPQILVACFEPLG